MLKTIKSKIIVLTISVLIILSLLMAGLFVFNFNSTKEMIIEGSSSNVATFAEQINKEIIQLEKNVLDLALLGEVYFRSNSRPDIANYMVQRVFQNYQNSLGGGIWFKPYATNPNKKLNCVYAFRDQTGKILIDPNFISEEYNYPKQKWYLEIMPQLHKSLQIAWSKPYFEKEGSQSLVITVGAGIYDKEKLVGLATVDWKISTILETISKIKPTPHSFALFVDKKNDYVISTTDPHLDNQQVLGHSLQDIPWYHSNFEEVSEFTYHNIHYLPYTKKLGNGIELIVNIPQDELFKSSIYYFTLGLIVMLFTSFAISFGIYFILKKNVNQPIDRLIKMATKIGQGNLNTKIDIESPIELASLSQTLNKMAVDLKANLARVSNMSKAKEKLESELSIARTIQISALPKNFPIHNAMELTAFMRTAKEVGGDFYDFFFINKNNFAFIIADVSGKGITAALYMMSAKTMIKNMLQVGYPLNVAADKVNIGLYDNNSRGMFVTAFICVLNLTTGKIQYINAGHCPPLIKTAEGYHYLTPVRNLMLGIMPTQHYQAGEFTLNPEDRIFLYTDGITEAQTKTEKLFGKERLIKLLNQKTTSLSQTLERVQTGIHRFTKGAEQSDDITMMELIYHGSKKNVRTFSSDIKSWQKIKEFISRETKHLSFDSQLSVLLVAEEIFTNISKYAYHNIGNIRLTVHSNTKETKLEFLDWGKPFNPMKVLPKKSPKAIQKIPIGGLGISLVKKRVKSIRYSYKNGQNLLIVKI